VQSKTLPADYLKSNNFDLIRLFAAAQVALEHIVQFLNPASQPYIAWLAFFPSVPTFFFISGFLISASWERNPVLRAYVLNRFLRIYPALWAVFFLSVACVSIVDPRFLAVDVSRLALWAGAQLTVGQDWNPSFLRDFGLGAINGSLWTIPVEICFYVAIPVLYWIVRRFGNANLVFSTVIVLSFGLQYVLFIYRGADHIWLFPIRHLKLAPIPWIGMFAVGVLAQRNIRYLYGFVGGRFFLFLGLYAAISVVSAFFPAFPLLRGNFNSMGVLNFSALVLLVLSAAFSFRATADALLQRNDSSYGIYIYHMPLVNLFVQMHIVGFPGAAAVVGLTIFIALLSWFFIEKPALSLRHHALHWRK
jgi:peptidoglycan/LPS O-acetylase OafA/YrhL